MEKYMELELNVEVLSRELYSQSAKYSADNGRFESAMKSLEDLQRKLAVLQDRILSEDSLAHTEIENVDRDIKSFRRELFEIPTHQKLATLTQHQLIDLSKTPDKINSKTTYSVVIGEFTYRVQFSEHIVAEVFRNSLYSVQSKKAVSAILNGFNSSASSHLKLVVPQTWILQTSILSKDVGTFRIYGVKKGQDIFFEKFIDKSNHSDKWMQTNLVPLMKSVYFEHFGENP